MLIHAGAGGVGSAAVQIVRSLGARVIATASVGNHDYLESIGAEPVAYGDGLVERVRALGTITASIDTYGDAASVAATVQLLPDLSRAVTVAASEHSTSAGIASVVHAPERLAAAVDLAAAGKLRLAIAERLPLADAARAFELSYAGHLRGKIILIA